MLICPIENQALICISVSNQLQKVNISTVFLENCVNEKRSLIFF